MSDIMKPGEVAALFKVAPKTVGCWAREGRLPAFFTMGGHARFRRAEIEALFAGEQPAAPVRPYAIPQRRDLSGRTMTVERLPDDATTTYGAPEGTVGRLAVLWRVDGKFMRIEAIAPEDADDVFAAGLAAAIAHPSSAVYVDLRMEES